LPDFPDSDERDKLDDRKMDDRNIAASPPTSERLVAGAGLLVILPALNEAATIQSVVGRIPRQIAGVAHVEVLVVDDGSTDDTVRLSRAAGASVISHGRNRGVGAAMQTGLDEAVRRRVDFAVNIDSDGQFAPEDIPALLAPLVAGSTEFATASRFKDPKLVPVMPLVKRFGNWGMARVVSSIVGQRFDDVSCGFRAYTREAMLQLVLSGAFTYTQEMLLVLGQKGMRMLEVPMVVRGVREHGKSRVASNLFRYGYRTSLIIFSCVRDFSPGSFFNASSFALAGLAFGFFLFFIIHRIVAGMFTPHIWAGFTSAFLLGLAFMIFSLGQVAAMVARIRRIQDRELYLLRKYLDRAEVAESSAARVVGAAEAEVAQS
jgi:glycosyltransferase involved in cell wall biosynthesis